MTNLIDITKTLTDRQIKLIAFEAEGVDTRLPDFDKAFSNRTWNWIHKASNGIIDMGYVVRRCYYLVNGKKLEA